MSIESIINGVIDVEGDEYTNNPNDSGGPTKYGITLDALSNFRGHSCTSTDVEHLTRAEAFDLYHWVYVVEPGFDKVVAIEPGIGAELVDTGVNIGPPRAAMFLQRCLNALNLNGTKYEDIGVDGRCGRSTLTALKSFIDWRGAAGAVVLLKAINCLQGDYYIELAEKRSKDEAFVYGWLSQRVSLST